MQPSPRLVPWVVLAAELTWIYHSLIEIVLPSQLKSHCYCFCLHREFYNTAIDGTHKDQTMIKKFFSLTEEIQLFHLRGL